MQKIPPQGVTSHGQTVTILFADCGVPNSGDPQRIVGGQLAGTGQWPWQVALLASRVGLDQVS